MAPPWRLSAIPGGAALVRLTAALGAQSRPVASEQSVKNIAQAVRVYRLHRGAAPTAAMRPRRALRSAWMALAAASLLAVGLLASRTWQPGGPPGPLPLAGSPAKTLAVLAFAHLSDDKANEVLAAGVSDELLNVLARIRPVRSALRSGAQAAGLRRLARAVQIDAIP